MSKYSNLSSYYFNDLNFDSSWKLIFYIYHRDKEHNIIREPRYFEYFDKNKIKPFYYPDFKVGTRYYEIKGEQFIIRYNNGKVKGFINPYSDDKTIQTDKLKCIKKNKVILITIYEMTKYFEYFYKNYNDAYLEEFRRVNNESISNP